MCGIVGIFDSRARREIDCGLLDRMNESLFHRGPDDGGLHVEPGVGLGHRRLSIIDLSTGQQPLYNEDRSVVVVFNGEIYNFQELVPELQALGHTFRTRSDTEVIVHAWEAWGAACVRALSRHVRLCALGPQPRNPVSCARPPGRQAALLRAASRRTLDFRLGVEGAARSIRACRARSTRCAVEDYFAYGYVPEPRTIFKGVRKLPPGCTLTLKRGAAGSASRSNTGTCRSSPAAPVTEQEAGEELIHRLRESVKLRMISDVPLGAFLSGGVDSSAVVAMMAGLSAGAGRYVLHRVWRSGFQ